MRLLMYCDDVVMMDHVTLYVQQMNIIKITITITLKLMYMTYKSWEQRYWEIG